MIFIYYNMEMYCCEKCNYACKENWILNRHFESKKHTNADPNKESKGVKRFVCKCKKFYKSDKALIYHQNHNCTNHELVAELKLNNKELKKGLKESDTTIKKKNKIIKEKDIVIKEKEKIIEKEEEIKNEKKFKKKLKKNIPQALRIAVWNQYIGEDIGKSNCYVGCGTEIAQLRFECGHVIAETNGGENNN